MKIGQFSDSFYPIVDGVGRVVYNYAQTLGQKGHECYVVAPLTDTGYRGNMPFDLVDFVSVSVPTQKQYQTGVPILDPHYNRRMQGVKLDIIHAHSPFIAGQEALRIGKKQGIPVIGTFHSKYYDDFYKLTGTEMLADIGLRVVLNFFERCDEVWAVSYSAADTLADYGYKGDIKVMVNGTPDVKPDPQNIILAREHFALSDEPAIMYCGQLNWKKNILRTLEAVSLLKKRGERFKLLIVGQGPDADAIEKKCEELDISDLCVFTGHIKEDRLLNGLYQLSKVFVFPSLYDTSGMVVHEAAAMGTPSIVVRGSAPAEPVIDGENGLLCEDDSHELADRILYCLNNPIEAERMGKNAQRSIYKPWSDVVDEALIRYEAAAERHAQKKQQQ